MHHAGLRTAEDLGLHKDVTDSARHAAGMKCAALLRMPVIMAMCSSIYWKQPIVGQERRSENMYCHVITLSECPLGSYES
jgi:hypothetical protein